MGKHDYCSDYLRRNKIVCDCGGPQYGTDHALDCAWVFGVDDAEDAFKEEGRAA